MIPYLGGEKYFALLESCKQYHNDGNVIAPEDDENAENQVFVPPESEDEESFDEKEEEIKKEKAIMASLSHMDDDIVSELFISIINLITYFCLEAENYADNKNKIFDGISSDLNDNGREASLFASLGMPNDDVKLAVVKCLFVVPLDELDIDEISKIVAIVSQCQNIGAGKTELVLSTVYWIFFKLAHGPIDEEGASKIFQQKFGENAINEALSIMERNLEREIEPDDDEDD
jgi:hypothetical protein